MTLTPRSPQGRQRSRTTRAALFSAVMYAMLAACGGPVGPGPPPTPNDTVAETLDALGVDTSPSARVAPDGSALDDDAAPLGASAAYIDPAEFSDESRANPTMELVMARSFFAIDTLVVEELDGAGVTPGGDVEFGAEDVLVDLSAGNDWVTPVYDDGNQFQSLRDIAAGDLDGDGFDEIAAVYVDQSDGVLKLRTFEDDAAGYTERTSSLAAGADVRSVKLVALDDDGDGEAELMVAISFDDRVELTPIVPSGSGYALDDAAKIVLPQQVTDSTLYVRLVAGQLDYDNALELAVVVNEVTGSSSTTA